MTNTDFSENALVEQPAIALFGELGYATANCFYEKVGTTSVHAWAGKRLPMWSWSRSCKLHSRSSTPACGRRCDPTGRSRN